MKKLLNSNAVALLHFFLLYILCDFHSAKAFHEGDGEDHSVYAHDNIKYINLHDVESDEVQYQGIDQLNPDGQVIIEKDGSAPSKSGIVSTLKYVEVEDSTTESPTTSTRKTTKAPTVKPKNKPLPKIPSTGTEKQFSRQQKVTETTKKSSATKKPTPVPKNSVKKATNTPSTTTSTGVPSTSTENVTEPDETTTAVSKTSTEVIPTAKPKTPLNNLYCLCDLHIHSCDMNCCCDIDCSDEERSMFTGCEEGAGLHDQRSAARRQRSCYQSFVFFKHFETQTLERTEKGMLCIVRDNNREDNELSSANINQIRNNIINGKINIRKKYEWRRGNEIDYELNPYQFGSPILAVINSDVSKDLGKASVAFGLPASYHESSCTIREPVRFLENVQSHCKIRLENATRDCTKLNILDSNSFIKNLKIIGNPDHEDLRLVEITRNQQCKGESCTSEDADTETLEFNKPALQTRKRICQDVLKRLELTVFYEGVDGIFEVTANAELQDVLLNSSHVFQEYTVKFIWSRDDNISSSAKDHGDWPRSGNPGYIVGKPVIFGEKVKVIDSGKNETVVDKEGHEPKEEDRILVWNDPAKWMTILGPGICSANPIENPRKSVVFDYGQSSSCSLNLTRFKYCEDVQIEVAKILLGSEDPANFEKRDWHVAAYGNSDPQEHSEWVPLNYRNFPIISTPKGSSKSLISKGCEGIVSALHISIAYAFVGSIDFPQARITGVLYELGDSIPVPAVQSAECIQNNCQSQNDHISVTTSVTFKDVTMPPVTRVAKWPVVSIRLPADFFYPFSSPSSASHEIKFFSSLMVVIMIFANTMFSIGV